MSERVDIPGILSENMGVWQSLGFLVVLVGGAVLLLIIGLLFEKKWLTTACFLFVLLSALVMIEDQPMILFSGWIRLTPLAAAIQRICILTVMILPIFPGMISKPFEYYFLLLGVLIGALFLTIAQHWALIYLALEMTSLCGYLLTAMSFRKTGYEGAFKYLVIGGVSGALMIYGISLLYGFSGHFFIGSFGEMGAGQALAWILVLFGILFKISAFPLHSWVPNTYQAGETSWVALLSVVPKLGGLILLSHLVTAAEQPMLVYLLLGFALITVLLGTFAALPQRELKRLIAYGAIAHTGLMMSLVLIGTQGALDTFIMYAIVYAIMNLAIFYFIATKEERGLLLLDRIDGMGKTEPVMGVSISVVLIALIGLPPTAGFSIKLMLFTEILAQYHATSNYWWLLFFIVGVLSTAVALFYYLRVPFHFFLKTSSRPFPHPSRWQGIITTFFALVLLWIFMDPEIFHNFALTIRKP